MENSFFGSAFGVSDIYDIKLFTRLSLCFSRFYEHKFRYGFNDTMNLMGNTLFAEVLTCAMYCGSCSNIYFNNATSTLSTLC